MKIQIMHFGGCPHKAYALQSLREVLAEENIAAEVEEIRVETDADARRWSFLGSPTIRVDGLDVEGIDAPNIYPGLRCRIYKTQDGQLYYPPKELIRWAVRAQDSEEELGLVGCCG